MSKSIQSLFVDRITHTANFTKMLTGQTDRQIMLLSGAAGMGKSWLLHIFAHEARSRAVPVALVDFADGLTYDGQLIIRRCRDALGSDCFQHLTQTMNDLVTPSIRLTAEGGEAAGVSLSVAGSQVGDLRVGDVAGQNIIKDNQFMLSADSPEQRRLLEDRINGAFFYCLSNLCQRGPVVLLFDAYEHTSRLGDEWVSRASDQWVVSELLYRIRNGRLLNVVVVIAGRRFPRFGVEWNDVLGTAQLGRLQYDDAKEYLQQRRALTMLSEEEAVRLYQAARGHPHLLGVMADNLDTELSSTDQDDW